MPKVAKELTPLAVRKLKHDGRSSAMVVAVGGVPGLMISVSPSNAKAWLLRYRFGDKRRDLGLGGFPEVGLADARDAARDARQQVRDGIDPLDARNASPKRIPSLFGALPTL